MSKKPKKPSIVDEEAIGRACRKYMSFMRGASREDREDAMQEAYRILLSKDREIANPAAYRQTVIKNTFSTLLKEKRRRDENVVHFEAATEHLEQLASDDPSIALLEDEDRRALWAAIDGLPDYQRQAIQLQLYGLSYEEIASHLEITLESVRTFISRARKSLLATLKGGSKWK